MVVIAERINASRKAIGEALRSRDEDLIACVAAEQAQAGANYIDVNGGDPDPAKEAENIAWLIDVVQQTAAAGISVDSADPATMRIGLGKARSKPILNSISLEKSRLDNMLPVAREHDCRVIGLLMSDDGSPGGQDDRLARAGKLIDKLAPAGKGLDEIIIDPCFFPLSVDAGAVAEAIASISAIKARWPGVHVCGGVSNASYGLPQRKYVNLAVMVQAIVAGMDYGIIDPCVPGTMGLIYAAEALAGRDDFCMNYVTAAREGKLT